MKNRIKQVNWRETQEKLIDQNKPTLSGYVNVRLGQKLVAEIDAAAQEFHMTRSEAIRRILSRNPMGHLLEHEMEELRSARTENAKAVDRLLARWNERKWAQEVLTELIEDPAPTKNKKVK